MERLKVERIPVYRPKPLTKFAGALPAEEAAKRRAEAQRRADTNESLRAAVIAVFTFPLFYLVLVLLLLAGGAR